MKYGLAAAFTKLVVKLVHALYRRSFYRNYSKPLYVFTPKSFITSDAHFIPTISIISEGTF